MQRHKTLNVEIEKVLASHTFNFVVWINFQKLLQLTCSPRVDTLRSIARVSQFPGINNKRYCANNMPMIIK